MNSLKHTFLALALLLPGLVMAQTDDDPKDGGIGNESVDVVFPYDPIIADAVKTNYPATIPDTEQEAPTMDYEVPIQLIPLPYELVEVRPLAISREKIKMHPSSYIKAGFGTQLSPLFEFMFNDVVLDDRERSQKLHYGAYFKHHSAWKSKIKHQDFNYNHASAFANAYLKRVKWQNTLNYHRDNVYYYGYDHEDTTLNIEKQDIRQRFNIYEYRTDVGLVQVSDKPFDFTAGGGFYYINDNRDQSEWALDARMGMQLTFKMRHRIYLDLWEDYSMYSRADTFEQNRNIFSVKPKYEYRDEKWQVFGGLEVLFDDSQFRLFPDLGLQRSLFNDYLVLYGGWKMELRKNSYRSLTAENPWTGPNIMLDNSWFEDRFAGLKGTIQNFTYDVRFGQKLIRDLPLFIADSLDTKQFTVVYEDRANILNGHVELGYRALPQLNFMLTGDFYFYDMKSEARPWHMPNLDINFKTQYNIGDKVYLTLDVFGRDGVYGWDAEDMEEVELKGTVDLNLGATYKFSKYLSFFINLNNLAARKYERWYNYPTYGFNGMVGATFTY